MRGLLFDFQELSGIVRWCRHLSGARCERESLKMALCKRCTRANRAVDWRAIKYWLVPPTVGIILPRNASRMVSDVHFNLHASCFSLTEYTIYSTCFVVTTHYHFRLCRSYVFLKFILACNDFCVPSFFIISCELEVTTHIIVFGLYSVYLAQIILGISTYNLIFKFCIFISKYCFYYQRKIGL